MIGSQIFKANRQWVTIVIVVCGFHDKWYDGVLWQDGLECHLVGLMQSLVEGLDTVAQAELDKSKKVSEEEWEQIKPSKTERKNTLLQFIRVI